MSGFEFSDKRQREEARGYCPEHPIDPRVYRETNRILDALDEDGIVVDDFTAMLARNLARDLVTYRDRRKQADS
jgi:FtsZ-interacting cell division protein YlmF